ncbi:MAG: hypothetical protein KGQ26_02695 [Rhodospirillales bacterium]|nr:hypothetical protein [Rhodospirillales bacterium]
MNPSHISALPPSASARGSGTSWLAVGSMLADLAFETDRLGRFTAFGPGRVLGRQAGEMLGAELASLLSGPSAEEAALSANEFQSIVVTICVECVAWHGRVRLGGPEGAPRLYRLSLAPRLSGGSVAGIYGLLFDMEAPELSLPSTADETGMGMPFRITSILDAETGFWTSKTFGDEITRRLDRLDVEEQPGTLLYLGFSRAEEDLWPSVAMRLAEELRDIVRPTDLLGRIDGSTIGLWCDNMDHLTGGERAAKFCATLPALLPKQAQITVGVVPRWPGSGEDASTVMEHAAVTLRLADFASAGETGLMSAWRVWQTD